MHYWLVWNVLGFLLLCRRWHIKRPWVNVFIVVNGWLYDLRPPHCLLFLSLSPLSLFSGLLLSKELFSHLSLLILVSLLFPVDYLPLIWIMLVIVLNPGVTIAVLCLVKKLKVFECSVWIEHGHHIVHEYVPETDVEKDAWLIITCCGPSFNWLCGILWICRPWLCPTVTDPLLSQHCSVKVNHYHCEF